jgi:hypothetical protein
VALKAKKSGNPMPKRTGKTVWISPFRRLVIDLMTFSQKVPTVTVDRRMNLGALTEARQACFPRPTWTALFTKAYSLVAARDERLRRCYMSFPFPRFFECQKNTATLNIGRCVNGEEIVLHAHVRSPENRSLTEIDEIVHYFMETSVEEINSYRRVRRVSYLPGPVRRALMWATLNLFGRHRCHNFGTFGLTSVSGQGAGILNLVPLLTSTIHYGLLDDKGGLEVRLSFDHRVIDGATAAESLLHLEVTLLGEILDEVRSLKTPIQARPTAA